MAICSEREGSRPWRAPVDDAPIPAGERQLRLGKLEANVPTDRDRSFFDHTGEAALARMLANPERARLCCVRARVSSAPTLLLAVSLLDPSIALGSKV